MFKKLIAIALIAIVSAEEEAADEYTFHELVNDLPSIHFVPSKQNNPRYDMLLSSPMPEEGKTYE